MQTKLSIVELAQRRDSELALVANTGPSEEQIGAFLELMQDPSYIKLAASTEEFGWLTETVLQRSLMAMYTAQPLDMLSVFRVREDIPNFNEVSSVSVTGGESRMQKVLEQGEYLQTYMSEGPERTYRVTKWGQVLECSWEAFLADALGVFESVPRRFNTAAQRTLGWFLTNLLFDADGPRSSAFVATGGQASISAIPFTSLEPAGLETAITEMMSYTDADGNPIALRPAYLMVPPALMIPAMQKLQSVALAPVVDTTGTGTGNPLLAPTANPIRNWNLKLIVNPWIPVVCTSGTVGQTSWALFTDPGDLPIAEVGFLTGHRVPKIETRDDGRLSWTTDSMGWKVRHVFGGVTLDPRAGWASTGQ